MSWSKGQRFERYLKLFSTSVSPGEPKYIGVDETYSPDGTCVLVAAYSSDPSVLRRTCLGGKIRGSGFYMDEIPAINFNYGVVPASFFRLAEERKLYTPQSRPEEAANDNFSRYMVDIDMEALFLSIIMGHQDRALVHGYWRPEIVQEKIIRRMAGLTGREGSELNVRCHGSECTVPALRAADNIGYRLRNRLDEFPERRIEFTEDDLLSMNLDRHALREFRKSGREATQEAGFVPFDAQAVPA